MIAWVVMLHGTVAWGAPRHEGPPPLELSVGEADPLHFGLGASVWLRGEVRAESGEPTFVIPARTRAQVEARWRGLRSFVQFQDVRRWGSSADLTTSATTGLHQGYLELSGRWGAASGFIRVGRQQHFLGSMRVMGIAPWNPNMRSLDALRVHGEHGPFSFDVAGALLRPPETLELVDDTGDAYQVRHRGEGLLTAAARAQVHRAFDLEGYALLRSYAPTVDDPTRDRLVFSPGGRLLGQPWRGLHYELEGYVQSGRWDGVPHAAWLGAATVGYAWERGPRPQVEGGYVAASGGRCDRVGDQVVCNREVHRDFDGLLGARHRFYGVADLFAPTNAHDGWVGARVSPGGWTELRAELHHFALHDPTGRWLRTNEAPVGSGPDPDNRQRTLGEEVDLRASLHPWGPLTLQAGHAVFVPTGAGRGLVGTRPLQFGYLLVELAF
ncbi:MAG: alginate export family protein [Myxococcales bacterium]|nr:alginate export family protein [Myxococcales bacterium]